MELIIATCIASAAYLTPKGLALWAQVNYAKKALAQQAAFAQEVPAFGAEEGDGSYV